MLSKHSEGKKVNGPNSTTVCHHTMSKCLLENKISGWHEQK